MIWYSLTEDHRITKKNVEEKSLVPPGKCFPKMYPLPTLRAKIVTPHKEQFLRNPFPQQKKGEDTMTYSKKNLKDG